MLEAKDIAGMYPTIAKQTKLELDLIDVTDNFDHLELERLMDNSIVICSVTVDCPVRRRPHQVTSFRFMHLAFNSATTAAREVIVGYR